MTKLIRDDGTEAEISEETERKLREMFGKKKEFTPIKIHGGCFVVSVNGGVVRINSTIGSCFQEPSSIRQFIEALESASDFIEKK